MNLLQEFPFPLPKKRSTLIVLFNNSDIPVMFFTSHNGKSWLWEDSETGARRTIDEVSLSKQWSSGTTYWALLDWDDPNSLVDATKLVKSNLGDGKSEKVCSAGVKKSRFKPTTLVVYREKPTLVVYREKPSAKIYSHG